LGCSKKWYVYAIEHAFNKRIRIGWAETAKNEKIDYKYKSFQLQ